MAYGLCRGRPQSKCLEPLKPVILNSYRRILSCKFVRAQESCLLARQGHLDTGARDAAARRRVLVREEEMVRKEARAFHQAYVRGRGMKRTGQLVR